MKRNDVIINECLRNIYYGIAYGRGKGLNRDFVNRIDDVKKSDR